MYTIEKRSEIDTPNSFRELKRQGEGDVLPQWLRGTQSPPPDLFFQEPFVFHKPREGPHDDKEKQEEMGRRVWTDEDRHLRRKICGTGYESRVDPGTNRGPRRKSAPLHPSRRLSVNDDDVDEVTLQR